MPSSTPFIDRPFRVIEATALTDAIWRLVLSTVDSTSVDYREGQFINLGLPDGVRRSYSMASPCGGDGRLEFNIRLLPDGHFSTWLRGANRTGAILAASGPFGDCVWQHAAAPRAPVLMLATGTGIAPLKAMLERALADGETPPITLYWGGDQEHDLYLDGHFHALARQHARFRYVPTLGAAPATWQGRREWVQLAAAQDHPDLRDATVYACGAPRMVDEARALLVGRHGLPVGRFLADAFVSTPGPVTETPADAHLELRASDTRGRPHTLRVSPGNNLMHSLAGAGLLVGACGGQAACGNCRVRVPAPWLERLSPPGRQEARLLKALDSLPEHRLACQITLAADLDGALVHCS